MLRERAFSYVQAIVYFHAGGVIFGRDLRPPWKRPTLLDFELEMDIFPLDSLLGKN